MNSNITLSHEDRLPTVHDLRNLVYSLQQRLQVIRQDSERALSTGGTDDMILALNHNYDEMATALADTEALDASLRALDGDPRDIAGPSTVSGVGR